MKILSLFLLIALAAPTTISLAEEKGGGGAAEMARKLQDPLANIKAVMTDNTIGFNTGDDDGTSYGFQIQPVYAIDLPDKGHGPRTGNENMDHGGRWGPDAFRIEQGVGIGGQRAAAFLLTSYQKQLEIWRWSAIFACHPYR
jgi:hypothetical protein